MSDQKHFIGSEHIASVSKTISEQSDEIDAALDVLAESRLHADAVRGKINFVSFYTKCVVMLSIVAALGMLFFVAPRAAIVIATIFVLITFVMMICSRVSRFKIFFDKMKLRLPIVRDVERKRSLAILAEQLSQVAADCEPEIAMRIASKDSRINKTFVSPIVREFEVSSLLNDGSVRMSFAETFERCGVFPQMILCYLKKGEGVKSVSETFTKISDFYKEEIESAGDAVTSLAQPAAICLMIAVVSVVFYFLWGQGGNAPS